MFISWLLRPFSCCFSRWIRSYSSHDVFFVNKLINSRSRRTVRVSGRDRKTGFWSTPDTFRLSWVPFLNLESNRLILEMTSNEDVSRHGTKVKKSTVGDATSSTNGKSKTGGRSPRKTISFVSSKFWLRLVRPWKWRNLRRKVRRFVFLDHSESLTWIIDFSEATVRGHLLQTASTPSLTFLQRLHPCQNCHL